MIKLLSQKEFPSLMSIIAQAREVDIKFDDHEITVPDGTISKLKYYLNCVNSLI